MAAVSIPRRTAGPAQTEAPSESLSRRDAAERQNRILLHAWQTAHPVLYQGVRRHLHTLTFQKPGGNPEVVVYLIGNPEPVPAMELEPCPHHRNTQRDSPAPTENEQEPEMENA